MNGPQQTAYFLFILNSMHFSFFRGVFFIILSVWKQDVDWTLWQKFSRYADAALWIHCC